MTPDLFWIIGAWVGDGWVGRRKSRAGNVSSIIICCPEKDTDFLLNKMKKAGLHAVIVKERTVNKLWVYSRSFATWIVNNFGEKAYGKKIPGWLYETAEPYRRALFEGYMWADGYSKGKVLRATTVCRGLAFGVALLGTSLGLSCSVYKVKMPPTCEIEGRICNQKDQFFVATRNPHEQEKTTVFTIGNHSFSKCRKAAEINSPTTVFNISVEDDESYIAEGLVVHNCQPFSLAGDRKGLEDPRGELLNEFVRVVREALPVAFVMENVKGMASWSGGKALAMVMDELSKPIEFEGIRYRYEVVNQVLNASDYGVPQKRERLFIVGNRKFKDFVFPAPMARQVTVREAICGLPQADEPSEVASRVAGTIDERAKNARNP